MGEKVSREHILEVIKEVTEEKNFNLQEELIKAMDVLDPEQRKNPACGDIVVASITQGHVMAIMAEVLYRIVNE